MNTRRTRSFISSHKTVLKSFTTIYDKLMLYNPTRNTCLTDDELLLRGDNVVQSIIWSLTTLKNFKLHPYQLHFCQVAVTTMMYHFYRDVWNTQKDAIFKRHHMAVEESSFFLRAPRRMGKTITLAIFCMCIITNVVNDPVTPFTINVFAVSKSSATMFLSACANYWYRINKSSEFNIVVHQNCIRVTRISDPSDVRYVLAFCSGDVCYYYGGRVCMCSEMYERQIIGIFLKVIRVYEIF